MLANLIPTQEEGARTDFLLLFTEGTYKRESSRAIHFQTRSVSPISNQYGLIIYLKITVFTSL
ncbi:MAG: hypothetical protein OXM55_02885 [Bdellovibrionales bacterium]|nr:hypothetical protein [Bdellovibrionales bacterium]